MPIESRSTSVSPGHCHATLFFTDREQCCTILTTLGLASLSLSKQHILHILHQSHALPTHCRLLAFFAVALPAPSARACVPPPPPTPHACLWPPARSIKPKLVPFLFSRILWEVGRGRGLIRDQKKGSDVEGGMEGVVRWMRILPDTVGGGGALGTEVGSGLRAPKLRAFSRDVERDLLSTYDWEAGRERKGREGRAGRSPGTGG